MSYKIGIKIIKAYGFSYSKMVLVSENIIVFG